MHASEFCVYYHQEYIFSVDKQINTHKTYKQKNTLLGDQLYKVHINLIHKVPPVAPTEVDISLGKPDEGCKSSVQGNVCAKRAPSRGVWGHVPPGKLGISDLLRLFLTQFWSKT